MTHTEKKLKWRLVNSERKQYRKDYYSKRILKKLAWTTNYYCKDGKITAFDLWKIAKKQRLICPLTGEKLTNKNISVDHILPKSNGGTNEISNIRLIILQANRAKQSLTDTELYGLCKKIIECAGGVVNFSALGVPPVSTEAK
jgi:5-methylcytosine-specific restriction endonuclease McrA